MHSSHRYDGRMKIGKPLILTLTPIGVAGGVYEAWRLAGGLVFLMIAMLSLIGVAIGTVVSTVRREQAAERAGSARPAAYPDEGPGEGSMEGKQQ
jgi:hypothetical protein